MECKCDKCVEPCKEQVTDSEYTICDMCISDDHLRYYQVFKICKIKSLHYQAARSEGDAADSALAEDLWYENDESNDEYEAQQVDEN